MKPTIYRRVRRHPASREAASFSKEKQHEQAFFGEPSHDPFFKTSNGIAAGKSLQLKPFDSINEATQIQRMEDKKEEEKKVHRKEEDKEEKVQKKAENLEEEEKVQKKEEKKEEEKKISRQKDEKEDEKIQKKTNDPKEEKVQKKEEVKDEKKDSAKLQRKESATSSTGTSANYISSMNGKGNQLPPDTNAFFSSRMGYDFSDVKVHTNREAADSAKELNAIAYTVHNNIVFNEGQFNPETSMGKKLMAHELTHVVQQGSSKKEKEQTAHHYLGNRTTASTVQRMPLLNAIAEKAAIAHNRKLFDNKSVMIIQLITGSKVDGDMGPLTAEAIASFQTANGLAANGKVEDATLDALFTDRVTRGRQEHAIQLVVDYNNFDRTDILNFHFDPAILFSDTVFQPGGMRLVTLGPLAFLSASFLKALIEIELLKPPPAVPAIGPKPTLLSSAKETSAISYNRIKYQDSRAVRAIQGLVGATPSGKFDSDTAERVADFQSTNGISIDGKVGEETLRVFVTQLNVANQQDTAIRLIMDFYNMNEFGALIEIFFDPTLAGSNAETPSKDIPGPDIIKIGPLAFAQGYPGLVHTIAHELEHIRQNKLGIADIPLSEFLGESIEIISKDMPDEDVAGFFDDAGRAMDNWDLMKLADQKKNWNKFLSVRKAVKRRFAAATVAEQAIHLVLMTRYNATIKPS
jgi:peptidoglycan hydrolase-like protein with peptidoglycan-binding domain